MAQPYLSAIERGERPFSKKKFEVLYNHYGDVVIDYKMPDVVIEFARDAKDIIRSGDNLIPFYDDIMSMGGVKEKLSLIQGSGEHVSEWIDSGDLFPEATAAIRHYGDSMVEYPSGSVLALKRVNDRRLIINGRNYVITTTEFRIAKQLQDDGFDYVSAYSSNKEKYPDGRQIHSPIRIPKESILQIDLILGCITKEYANRVVFITTDNNLNGGQNDEEQPG